MPRDTPPHFSTWDAMLLGLFVLPFQTTDPGLDTMTKWPDGTCILYESGGNRYIDTYVRATGWKRVQVT